MQTIFRTTPASNFTLLANDLVNTPMPFKAKEVLFYLLAKPKDWRVKVADIRNTLALTTHTIRKSLEWLQQAGYAGYVRLKTGHTIWKIFDRPQVAPQTETAYSPRVMPQAVMPHMAKPSVLQITETETKKETTTPEPIKQPDTVIPVVVSLEEEKPVELKYPEQLKPKQKADIKHHIKKAPVEHRQAILATLAHYLAKGTIYNPIGWIRSQAEGAAKTGTYEPVGAASATKPDTRHIDQTQERLKAARAIKRSSDEKAKGGFQQAKLALRGIL